MIITWKNLYNLWSKWIYFFFDFYLSILDAVSFDINHTGFELFELVILLFNFIGNWDHKRALPHNLIILFSRST